MIQVDISKIVPQKAYALVAAFVPGVFFEASILLANPGIIRSYVSETRTAVGLGYYSSLALALVLAWIIGSAFLFLVSLIQWAFCWLYEIKTLVWRQFCKRILLPRVGRRLSRPNTKLRRTLVRIQRHALDKLSPPGKLKDVYKASDLAATTLLKNRYGIDRRTSGQDWDVWYALLAKPTAKDMRGDLSTMSIHAAGWSGIAAALSLAPSLKHAYYIGFCLFLIFIGVLHDWAVASRRVNPLVNALIKTRSILDTLRDSPSEGPSRPG